MIISNKTIFISIALICCASISINGENLPLERITLSENQELMPKQTVKEIVPNTETEINKSYAVRFGLGLGIPYGDIGSNIEFNINNNLSFSCGVGFSEGVSNTLGARFYFSKPENKIRFCLSYFYGTVKFLTSDPQHYYDDYFYRNVNGSTYGFGLKWNFTKSSLNFDILLNPFTVPSWYGGGERNYTKILGSIGYGWHL